MSGNMIVLSVLYKGGLLMGSEHMTVGELTSFLMYAFWVGISIAGKNKMHEQTTCIISPQYLTIMDKCQYVYVVFLTGGYCLCTVNCKA